MDILITCTRSISEPNTARYMEVTLEDIHKVDLDNDAVAECVSIDRFVKVHGYENLLDEIGIENVKGHFKLTEAE